MFDSFCRITWKDRNSEPMRLENNPQGPTWLESSTGCPSTGWLLVILCSCIVHDEEDMQKCDHVDLSSHCCFLSSKLIFQKKYPRIPIISPPNLLSSHTRIIPWKHRLSRSSYSYSFSAGGKVPSTTKPKPDRTAEMEGMIRNDGIKLVGLLMIKRGVENN